MRNIKLQSYTVVEKIFDEMDIICLRIKAINISYKQIINKKLKIRLIAEHNLLKLKFIEIKPIIALINKNSSNDYCLSRLLEEKYNRNEKEIVKLNHLFFS